MIEQQEKLTKRERQVLIELMKNSKISDQEIARRLRTSRPTVLKIRKRLEEKKIIKKYITLVDYEKLGLKIHAAILYRWKDYSKSEDLEKVIKLIKSLPEVILFIKGEGIGRTDLIISLHEDLKDYESFIRRLKYQWKDNIEDVEVFISSLDGIFKEYELASPVVDKLDEKVIYSR